SCSCTFFMFSCICCACFIRPASCPFMVSSLSLCGFDVAHASTEVADQLLHERVALDLLHCARLLQLALACCDLDWRSTAGFTQRNGDLQIGTVARAQRRLEPLLIALLEEFLVRPGQSQFDTPLVEIYELAVLRKLFRHR